MSNPASNVKVSSAHQALDSKPHCRPRFEMSVRMDVATVLCRVRAQLGHTTTVTGMVLDSGRIELTEARERVRFWSPQLTIDVVAEDPENRDRGALLRARFAPHPHIWGLYVALYATSIAFGIGCTMYGVSQWIVDSQPSALFWIPLSLVLCGLVYGASYVGQGLGALQMLELRSFVEVALREAPPSSDQNS